MLETITMAPPDAILGLTEAFKQDPNPDKINLGVGIYKDAEGRTPVLRSVKAAERRISASERSKAYLPITGAEEFAAGVRELLFGAGSGRPAPGHAAVLHTPGGTGALRVAGDFMKKMFPNGAIWMSEPTWNNHPAVFKAAGVPVKTYPYYDMQENRLDFGKMLNAFGKIPAGDTVLLHGRCHNPTGQDPSPEQWEQIAGTLAARKIFPLLDFAYQGFGDGMDEDAACVRALLDKVPEMFVAASCSKNFGLYRERVGALTVVTDSPEKTEKVLSHLKIAVRTSYSNPPAHGAAIVTAILGDAELRRIWEEELDAMRGRINGMRRLFAETMAREAPGRDFSFIQEQRGMFSLTGLNARQVKTLREKYSIYMVSSGRVNVAGMTEANMDQLCRAIASVFNG